MAEVRPRVIVAVCLSVAWCFAIAAQGAAPSTSPTHSASTTAKSAPKRSLSFTLENDSVTGSIPFGSELSIGVVFTGGLPPTESLVAVVEGQAIDTVMVPMEPTDTPSQWKASLAIKPRPLGYTSVRPKALRVRVTVSQVRQSSLQRLLGRSAYITMAHEEPEPPSAEGEPSGAEVDLVATAASSSGDEMQPDVTPVANALIAEEDLKPLPESRGQQAYWNEIARLISRSWGQKIRYAKGVNAARETVRVIFRMHSNGEAQLIQVERTSGVRDVDEAGLLAIVHAHPFPPFRDAVGDEAVDVHVRMRTGAKPAAVARPAASSPVQVEVQPVAPSGTKPTADAKRTP